MLDSVERLINLAFALAHSRGGLTRAQIREEVRGYPLDQDDAAFARMFERDKKWLRSVGLAIESAEDVYTLDAASTFASSLDLTAEEASVIEAVGVATAGDPAFPFPDELRFALSKLATRFEREERPIVVHTADESPSLQAQYVAQLEDSATRLKTVRFDYTNAKDEQKGHAVEPFGLYFREGRWYLVGRDVDLDAQRTYAVSRMAELEVNPRKPETPDFDRPDTFDVADAIALPFQYGTGRQAVAVVTFSAGTEWRAEAITAGKGSLKPLADGSIEWRVNYASGERLCRWLIENGPGLSIASPPELRELVRDRLGDVIASHEEVAS